MCFDQQNVICVLPLIKEALINPSELKMRNQTKREWKNFNAIPV